MKTVRMEGIYLDSELRIPHGVLLIITRMEELNLKGFTTMV